LDRSNFREMKTEKLSATPAPQGQLHPLSVEAYHVLGETGFLQKKTELLYGLVYFKMPKSPIHQVLIARLMRAFAKLDQRSFWVRSEGPITCVDSEPEPDVSVVRGGEDDYTHSHPTSAEFVAEVCVTSHEYDRAKLHAYATAGVKECWLVLQPEKVVEVYRKPANGTFVEMTSVPSPELLASEALPGVVVDLSQLFRE
jgi:Uma2 family endonuclease